MTNSVQIVQSTGGSNRSVRSRLSSKSARSTARKQQQLKQQQQKQHPQQQKQAPETFSKQVLEWTKKMSGMTCTGTLPAGFPGSEPSTSVGSFDGFYNNVCKPKQNHSNDDGDNHTLGTASTAAATNSYSMTDDHSELSEVGMEVVMSEKDATSSSSSSSASSSSSGVGPSVARGVASRAVADRMPTSVSSSSAAVTSAFTSGPTKRASVEVHKFKAGKETFTIDKRYSYIRTVGSGAYGVVISSRDAVQKRDVAIKMIPRAFNDEIDAKRILREIKLLKHFDHENVVNIVDMMQPQCSAVDDFNDVYIMIDLMETDLHRIIYSKQSLSIDHVQYFIYQVLRGLKYIHSANVIHRDLKPSNLLVNSNCDLKICDFGLARGILTDDDDDRLRTEMGSLLLTEYVVTRWYRAPEIMLACKEYSKPVDMWSVGCIFAELILRKPIFPGDDYLDQVRYVFVDRQHYAQLDLSW